ncbi:MAG: molybdenum cofactor synthesis domain-containing protein, partial [Candidatus Helarchaeota archaeon]
PDGANAVVMIEYTERKDDEVYIYRASTPNQYIIKIGTDIKKDSVVLKKGKILNIRDLGVLSAINVRKVKVFSAPRIGIFSSGDELIQPGEELSFGKIYDINSVTLYHGVLEAGGKPTFLGILKDDLDLMRKEILENIEKYDFLLISGGTSKGIGDYMPKIIKELKDLQFFIHGIRIKPGKPTILAALKKNQNSKLLAVLPGYPTSALTIFYQFISPLIYKFRHLSPKKYDVIKAKVRKRIYSEFGRKEFKTVRLFHANEIEAEAIHKGSESITTLAKTDGYIIIPEDIKIIEEGEEVEVHLFP